MTGQRMPHSTCVILSQCGRNGRLGARTSAGPEVQSVLTVGVPTAKASTMTFGKPS